MDKGLVETLLESLILEASPHGHVGPEEDASLMYKDAEWFQKSKGSFIKSVLASMNPSLDKLLHSLLADIDKKRPGVMGTAGNLFNKFGSWWKQWFGGKHENSLAIYSKINDFIINEISRAEKQALALGQQSQPFRQTPKGGVEKYQGGQDWAPWSPNPYSLQDSLTQLKLELNKELERIISSQYDRLYRNYLNWQNEKQKLQQRRMGLAAFAPAASARPPGSGKRPINRAVQVPSQPPEPEPETTDDKNTGIEDLEARRKRIDKIARDHDIEPTPEAPEATPPKSDEDKIKELIAKSDKTPEDDEELERILQATGEQGEFIALSTLLDKTIRNDREESLMWSLIDAVKDNTDLPADLKKKIKSHTDPFDEEG